MAEAAPPLVVEEGDVEVEREEPVPSPLSPDTDTKSTHRPRQHHHHHHHHHAAAHNNNATSYVEPIPLFAPSNLSNPTACTHCRESNLIPTIPTEYSLY